LQRRLKKSPRQTNKTIITNRPKKDKERKKAKAEKTKIEIS